MPKVKSSLKKKKTGSLRKMVSLIEQHMSEKGWSEDEKDARIERFSRRVKVLNHHNE